MKSLHAVKDRIPKGSCALSTAGHKSWKVKNPEKSKLEMKFECLNRKDNKCLEWLTEDVVKSPACGDKIKIAWISHKVQGLIQRSEGEMLWCVLCKRTDQMISLVCSGLQKYESML